MKRAEITRAVAVTAELCGTEVSEPALDVMVNDLARYPGAALSLALERCRREIKYKLTLADIIERIDDGWPSPEEAWAICPRGEGDTVVWTNEIAETFEVVRLMDDRIAARKAFLEIYQKKLLELRAQRVTPAWHTSLGHDIGARAATLRLAVDRGRLTLQSAATICPELKPPSSPEQLTDPTQVDRLLTAVANFTKLRPANPVENRGEDEKE